MTPPPPASLAATLSSSAAKAATLCHCLKVTTDQVGEAIDFHGCASVTDVTACCGAGGGCTACHHKIRALLCRD